MNDFGCQNWVSRCGHQQYMRRWIPALHLGKPRNLGCLHAGPAAYGAFWQAWEATLVNASRRLGAMGLLIAFDLRCSINQQA
jgi:hypothetical protein